MMIKSQVLADFIMEWTEVQMPPTVIDQECWTMYFDGLLMKKGTGTGLVFVSPLEVCMRYMLVVNQVMKESSCHDTKMAAYCQEVQWLEDKFDSLELNHVPRRLNEAADTLTKAASGLDWAEDGPSDLALRADPSTVLFDPEVMELEEDPAAEPDPSDNWRMPYLDYLLHDTLPTDKTEARQLAHCAKSFILVEGELYRRSHTRILQPCIPGEQGRLLLSDIHGGVCGLHAAPRTLVRNTFR
ncbi:uncharacterized protein [Miscanthus floridulus]|uniref:uncharacterized protein n=1 Tax=Miscanthus floridulus TaxID=154761 RepID=UPI0034591EED